MDKETLYIPGKIGIYDINLNTGKKNYKSISDKKAKEYGWAHGLRSVIIDDKLHTFGFYMDGYLDVSKHTVYDIKTKEIISTVSVPNSVDLDVYNIVYIKSQKKILFFGGDFHEEFMIYDIIKDEWEVLNVELSQNECWSAGFVITNADKYVIIMYGYHEWKPVNDSESMDYDSSECIPGTKIEILDIDNHLIRQSHVGLPMDLDVESPLFHAFMVNNLEKSEVIINGYLRNCWKEKEFVIVNQLPFELIGIILVYYREECVHLIERQSGGHWKIPLSHILDE